MLSLQWIEGRTGPSKYFRWSLAWLLSQYLAGYLLFRALGGSTALDQMFPHIFVMPLRYIGEAIRVPRSALTSSLLTAWISLSNHHGLGACRTCAATGERC
jgi:hypothetical protein